MVDIVMHGKRGLGIGVVDGAGRGKDQMLDAVVPAGLQYIGEPDQVSVDISMRLFEGIAHVRLRGQINDPVSPGLSQ